MDIREARLRPEFADRYPGLEPGVWFIAATLAEHLMGRYARRPSRDVSGPGAGAGAVAEPPVRVLDPEHFEFRGTGPSGGARAMIVRE